MNPPVYLRKRIVWLLAIKLLALVVIQQLFFGDAQRVPVDARQVESHLFVNDQAKGER